MSDQKDNVPTQPTPPSRNVFSGTGVTVIGIVRSFGTEVSPKNGKTYHELYLTTAGNPELKISLLAAPDSNRFQVGSLAKIMVRLHNWKNDKGFGTMLIESVPL